tara:strand:- start:7884 stop:8126 length:243 start_codon:yes stop_codon:yes gene_type:complete
MADFRCTKALLERLKKELDGKLECSAEAKRELEALIAELERTHQRDVSDARKQALITRSLGLLGLLVRLTIPEIQEFFGE